MPVQQLQGSAEHETAADLSLREDPSTHTSYTETEPHVRRARAFTSATVGTRDAKDSRPLLICNSVTAQCHLDIDISSTS